MPKAARPAAVPSSHSAIGGHCGRSLVNCSLSVIHVHKMDGQCVSTCGFECKLKVVLVQSLA